MNKIEERFKKPTNDSRPRLRYWWPGGYVANYLEELDSEMKEISEAGFGGVEISDVYDAISEKDAQVLDPKKYGFTSDNWRISVKQALKSAKKYGLKVDLTIGPHWPASTNEADPNDFGTAKELVYGSYSFNGELPSGTIIESLCSPHYKTSEKRIDGGEITNKLIAVYTAAHIDHKEVEMPPAVPWEEAYTVISDEIRFDSLEEITAKVKEGRLSEAVGTTHSNSIIIAVFERGTGQRVNMFSMGSSARPDVMEPYAYVVDHFSIEGFKWIKSLWEKNFFSDPGFLELLQKVGDCFFEDSLELQSVGHWTTDMLEQFEQRMGYDIRPYLPFVLGINQDKGLGVESSSFQVEKESKNKIQELRHDYFEVLNQLYQEHHLQPLKKWANTLKMNYRAQPYGWAIDSAAAAAKLDAAEGESLGFGEDGNDAFRLLAAGRDFGGIKILSDEAGAYLFQGYATTLSQLFETLHKNYMAGVNQTYWHGIPFKYAPGAQWPGFSAFNPMLGGRGFAEPWGKRQPVWEYLPAYTSYLGRLHELLRHGKNNLDVLVYQAGHNASENKKIEIGDQLTKMGYRYQVMTEGLFSEPVTIKGRVLYTKGASYRSLVIPKEVALSEKVKKAIEEWTRQGLSVIYQATAELEELVQILKVSDFKTDTGDLLTYQRSNEQHKFIFCYNQGAKSLSLSAFLHSYEVREWMPWTGEIATVRGAQLKAKDCRIFEVLGEGSAIVEELENAEVLSLKKHPWTLTLESWEMYSPENLVNKKTKRSKELSELSYWNKLNDFKNSSGVGTYKTVFDLKDQKPRGLHINSAAGSLLVRLNGQELQGNPLTGDYSLQHYSLTESFELEIVVGSTLNNYLNTSPLAEHYGEFPMQNYGIEDVELRF